jgi:CTP synthase
MDGQVEIDWLDTAELERNSGSCAEFLRKVDAVIVPGGFGTRGIEGKIQVIRCCRENGIPFLGICYGMQLAVVEYARHVVGLPGAHTTEAAEDGFEVADPVVCILPEQVGVTQKGGTMRLGGHNIVLKANSRAARLYKSEKIRERFRHRYEVNPDYVARLEKAGMVFSGHDPTGTIMQVLELPNHPYFLACQFHPELTSKLEEPAPLFRELIRVAFDRKKVLPA